MLNEKSTGWTSNSIKTLMALSGETIHKFVTVRNSLNAGERDWLFVFKSGWSFQVTRDKAYWVNAPEKTEGLLNVECKRREGFIESLEEVHDALEIYVTELEEP